MFVPTYTIVVMTNVLTKLHEDWTKHVTSRLLIGYTTAISGKMAHPQGKMPPPPATMLTGTIFELIQASKRTNVLAKFHENWTIHVTFRELTRKIAPYYSTDWNHF
ncbi:hypothetical protein DPMN_026362 [Dreissena polymorpha]|uniref:Uncharacterized protein n=1 Tax=Dreissena polymorpha TaxID=45954 RepID=A0A9D4LQZ3_DREPO|nr:hypothetical protein DPMN_026362 [Dreissena polymorpha]